jgi:3-hydroxyisobutyrate dehydrogenase
VESQEPMQKQIAPPSRVGFVGLGNMGAPMAGHLATAGYNVVVADTNAAALDRFCDRFNCERMASLQDMGKTCSLVITMLPDGNAVQQVLLGTQGIASALAPGSVVVDMSSSAPVGTRELHKQLANAGVSLVDAPVSGGVKRAVEGKLAIMAGGDADAIARCQLVFAALGQVFVTGVSGSGHAMKALNNYLSAIALAATAEAMTAGQKFGIDPKTMIEVLNNSTGRNTATEQKYPAFVLPRTFNSGFALGLMAKDLRIALGLTEAVATAAPLLRECSQLYNSAERRFGFAADNTEIVRYLESLPDTKTNG